MKTILITGLNGYIGSHLRQWIEYRHSDWIVVMLSVKNEEWRLLDFNAH